MNAFSNYTIELVGTDEEIKKATAVLAYVFDDESMFEKNRIEIEETYQFVWVEDVAKLAELMVKNAPTILDSQSLVLLIQVRVPVSIWTS